MTTIATEDAAEIYYKDWGAGQGHDIGLPRRSCRFDRPSRPEERRTRWPLRRTRRGHPLCRLARNETGKKVVLIAAISPSAIERSCRRFVVRQDKTHSSGVGE